MQLNFKWLYRGCISCNNLQNIIHNVLNFAEYGRISILVTIEKAKKLCPKKIVKKAILHNSKIIIFKSYYFQGGNFLDVILTVIYALSLTVEGH
ncbi:hypothetical protein BpHYR1_045958 [Brachionus plicatilis]|uniref:Uncharacterized protein n=1 Tax=Brachionus plicatilis TaxID=10195 RepID=A0A3M7T6S5_BRAPC|nr:hypothetical protein BpHYR1_045958 [Brachionus plicatilis]